jgi:serine protease
VALAGAGILSLVLCATTFPAGAQSQTSQSFGDAIRQRPVLKQPNRLEPTAFRITRERMAALREALALGLDYLPGEVIVKFRDGVTGGGQQRALASLRSRPGVESLRWIGDVAVLSDATQPNSRILAETLAEQPEVEYAEPHYFTSTGPRLASVAAPVARSLDPALTPTDPSYGLRQWNLPAIDLPRAWDINPGGASDVTIAVVDSGLTVGSFTLTGDVWTGEDFEMVTMPFSMSPDMSASRLTAPFDFVFLAAGGPVLDTVGHGTHVAGTAGQSTNNGVALAGVAYNTRIMPVKVCAGYWELMLILGALEEPGFLPPDAGFCPFDAVAAGIRYAADNGADVINISLGSTSPASVLRDAIQYAVNQGSFVSISMGNEFEDGNPTSYPAVYAGSIDGAMAVAALGRSLGRSFYSNVAAHTEIAAPGGDSRDGGASGLIYQVTLGPPSSPLLLVPRFDQFFEVGFQGTSMAAPHVSGVAALVISQIPGISPANVEAILRATARPCTSSSCPPGVGMAGSRTNEFGFGLVQPRAALFGSGIARGHR